MWKRSLVMRDVETETLWSHLLGKAMRGDLKGTELEILPGVMTTWGEWKGRHPKTTVLGMSRTARRYDESVWKKPKRFVYGVHLGAGKPAPAVAIAKLQEEKVVNVDAARTQVVVTYAGKGGRAQAFERSVDGVVLRFTFEQDDTMIDVSTSSRWDLASGLCREGTLKGKKLAPFPGTISYRVAWEEFFPDGKIVE